MPRTIKVPGLGLVDFPDDLPDDQIKAAIRRHLARLGAQAGGAVPSREQLAQRPTYTKPAVQSDPYEQALPDPADIATNPPVDLSRPDPEVEAYLKRASAGPFNLPSREPQVRAEPRIQPPVQVDRPRPVQAMPPGPVVPAAAAPEDPILRELAGAIPDPSLQGQGQEAPLWQKEAVKRVNQVVSAAGQAVGAGIAAVPKGIGVAAHQLDRAFGRERPVEEYPTYQLGQAIEQGVNQALPTDPTLDETFWYGTLPRAFGSAGAFIGTGVLGKVAGAPAWLATALTGAAAEGTSLYDAARKAGASDDNAFDAWLWGNLAGVTEAAPIARLFKRFDQATGGGIRKLLAEGFKGSLEEATQEVTQQIISNYGAQRTFDPSRELLTGTGEGGAAGGIVGLVTNLAAGALGPLRRARTLGPQQESQQQPSPQPQQPAPEASAQAPLPEEQPQPTGEVPALPPIGTPIVYAGPQGPIQAQIVGWQDQVPIVTVGQDTFPLTVPFEVQTSAPSAPTSIESFRERRGAGRREEPAPIPEFEPAEQPFLDEATRAAQEERRKANRPEAIVTAEELAALLEEPAARRAPGLEPPLEPEAEPAAVRAPAAEQPVPGISAGSDVRLVDRSEIETRPEEMQPRQGKGRYRTNPKQVEAIKESMARTGFDPTKPILVYPDNRTGKLVVLSGHHRLEAAEDLGIAQIPVQVYRGSYTQAVEEARRSNSQQAPLNAIEEAAAYAQEAAAGRSPEDIAKLYGGVKTSHVTDRLALNSLSQRLKDYVVQGLIDEKQAIVLGKKVNQYKLNEGLQDQIFDKIVAQIDLTPTELGAMLDTLAPHATKQLGLGLGFEIDQGFLDPLQEILEKNRQLGRERRQLKSFQNFIAARVKRGHAVPSEMAAAADSAEEEINRLEEEIRDVQASIGRGPRPPSAKAILDEPRVAPEGRLASRKRPRLPDRNLFVGERKLEVVTREIARLQKIGAPLPSDLTGLHRELQEDVRDFERESKLKDDKAKLDLAIRTKKPSGETQRGPLFRREKQLSFGEPQVRSEKSPIEDSVEIKGKPAVSPTDSRQIQVPEGKGREIQGMGEPIAYEPYHREVEFDPASQAPFPTVRPAGEAELELPVYAGAEAKRALFSRYGVPNAAPREGEPAFGKSRVLFVDDDTGQPIAYWDPYATAATEGQKGKDREEQGTREAQTGKAFRATLYRGLGKTREKVYGEEAVKAGRAVPILGPGTYYAGTRKEAADYGEVSEHEVELANPLVIDSNRQWYDLLRKADAVHLDTTSEAFFREPQKIPEATLRLQNYVKGLGHDGIIVKIAAHADVNERGESIKKLLKTFGHTQVAVFSKDVSDRQEQVTPGKGREEQVTAEEPITRAKVREQIRATVNANLQRRGASEISEEKIDAFMQVLDARAQAWAKLNDKTPAEWYRRKIARVTHEPVPEGEEGPGGPIWQDDGLLDSLFENPPTKPLRRPAAEAKVQREGEPVTDEEDLALEAQPGFTPWDDPERMFLKKGELFQKEGKGVTDPEFLEQWNQWQGWVAKEIFESTQDRDLTADLLQETFLRAWQTRSQITSPKHAPNYFRSIARNLAVDQARRKTGRNVSYRRAKGEEITGDPRTVSYATLAPHLIEKWFTVEAGIVEATNAGELSRLVQPLIAELPTNHQKTLALFLKHRFNKQAAAELGIPTTTYQSRLKAALDALQSKLREKGVRGPLYQDPQEPSKGLRRPLAKGEKKVRREGEPAQPADEEHLADEHRLQAGLEDPEFWFLKNGKLFQGPKGAIRFLEDGRAVIHLFERADASTLLHEAAHLFRREIEGRDLVTLERWLEVRDGKWAVEHEEKFARAFERWRRDGEVPVREPGLAAVFAKFKAWLAEIYQAVIGSEIDIDVPAEVQGVMRRLFEVDAAPRARPSRGVLLAKIRAFLPKSKPGQDPQLARRSEILRKISEALKVPIRTGRFRDRAFGIYKLKPEAIRLKLANDLATAAHELGHHVHKLLFGYELTEKTGRKGDTLNVSPLVNFASDLSPLAKSEPRLVEGFAEFVRLWLTDHAAADKHSPGLTAFFEAQLAKNRDLEAVLVEYREGVERYVNQPDVAKIFSMINFAEDQERPGFRILWKHFYAGMIDRLVHLRDAVEALEHMGGQKPGSLPTEEDAYKLARLLPGSLGAANVAIERGTFDPESLDDPKGMRFDGGKSLEQILDSVRGPLDPHLKHLTQDVEQITRALKHDNLNAFRVYLLARRAREKWEQGIDTGIPLETAKKAIEQLETPAMRQAAKDLYRWQDWSVAWLVAGGILDPETLRTIRQANRDYVPFYRFFEDRDPIALWTGKKLANLPQPIKRMVGSHRDIVDPLESIVRNAYTYINLAKRNEVARALVKQAESTEGSGWLIEKIDEPARVTKFQLEQIVGALKKAGFPLKRKPSGEYFLEGPIGEAGDIPVDLTQMAMIFHPRRLVSKDEPIITVFQDGKPTPYQVDKELHKVMLALDEQQINVLVRFLAFPTKMLRLGATSLSPEWFSRNWIRDTLSAWANTKNGFVPVIDSVRGLFHVLKRDDLFEEWKAAGGDIAAMAAIDRAHLRQSVKDLTRTPVGYVLRHPLESAAIFSQYFEAATRMGEYEKARKKGKTPREAALDAREVTLDFQRRGTWGKWINMVTVFWNAGVQDIDKFARTHRHRPRHAAIVGASIAAIELMNIALNHDDEDWQEVPRWQKDLFWLIPTKYLPGAELGKTLLKEMLPEPLAGLVDTKFVRLPKPFLWGLVYGSITGRVAEWIHTRDPHAFKGLVRSLLQASIPADLPTVAVPHLENWANKSFLTGWHQVPRHLEDVRPPFQAMPWTSQWARSTALALDKMGIEVSPIKIENAVFGYTAGAGRLVSQAVDALLPESRDVPSPAPTAADIPILRGFAVRYPTTRAESVEDFYDEITRLRKIKQSHKEFPDEAQAPSMAELARLEYMQEAEKHLRAMNQQIRRVYGDRHMSALEKRRELDGIYRQMTAAARSAMGRGRPQELTRQ